MSLLWGCALVTAGVAAAGPPVASAADPAWRTIVVGTDLDYPPFGSLVDGTPQGFSVDLLRAVAGRHQLHLTFVHGTWNELLARFQRGDIDVLSTMAASHDRTRFADFSVPYLVTRGAMFVRRGDSRIASAGDLAGRPLLVLRDDIMHEYAVADGWADHVTTTDSVGEAMRQLSGGRHDAVLASRLVGLTVLQQLGIHDVEPVDEPLQGSEQRWSFAVRKGDADLLARLDRGLADLRASREYAEIHERWFGVLSERDPLTARALRAAAITGGMLVLLLIAGAKWHASIRRQLDVRTRELHAREAESRTLSLVASRAHNLVLIADAGGTVTWSNDGTSDLTGLSPQDVAGEPLQNVFARLSADTETHSLVAGSLAACREFSVEVRTRPSGGGEDRSLVITAQPTGHDDRHDHWIVIGTDVTELKGAQEAIQRRTHQTVRYTSALLGLARSTPPDLDTALRQITEVTAHTLGTARVSVWFLDDGAAAIRCQDLFSAATGTHDSGFVLHAQDHPAYFAALRGHGAVHAAEALTDPRTASFADGYLRPLGISSMLDMPIWIEGRPAGVVCHEHVGPCRTWSDEECAFAASIADMVSLAVQTAERSRAERALRAERDRSQQIVMGSPAIIWGVKPDGTTTFVNPAAEGLCGYPAAEIVGRNVFPILYAGSDYAQVEEVFERLRNDSIHEHEMSLTTRSGERRTVAWNAIRRTDDSGQVIEIIAFGHDVTLRKQIEQDHRAARDAAEAASRLKSEFLATMSHEVRTPLNGVLGMMGLLLETPLGPEQREYVTTARQSGEALLDIVNDILDFSKIEAGKLSLEMLPFDARLVVEDSMALVAGRAFARGLELTCTADTGAPVTARGDYGRVRQVLVNLLDNAVKFTEHGEIRVHLSCGAGDAQAPSLRVEVVDTGVGLTRDQQSRIFLPFTQADGSTTRRYGGTGLGLSICRRLVELMGGEIGVTSTAGTGSTFWFTLPAAPAELPAPQPEDEHLHGVRVLVADAHATTREALAGLLTAWDIDRAEAADPAAALQILREASAAGQPFAVLMVSLAFAEETCALRQAVDREPAFARLRQIVMAPVGRTREVRLARPDVLGVLAKPLRRDQIRQMLLQAVAARPGENVGPSEATCAAPIAVASPRVLVAEDNVVNQKVAVGMLQRRGCRVDVVPNGLDAVAATANTPYALVLMDCQMPELDGLDATRAIRAREAAMSAARRLPIVAMTANAMQGDREQCLAAGMDDYLAKPVSVDELDRILQQWVTDTPALPLTA